MQFTVDSAQLWNDSGIILLANVSYRIEPAPGSIWYDAGIASGPEGYSNWYVDLWHGLLRVPSVKGVRAQFFELMGSFAEIDTQAFIISTGVTVTPTQDSTLHAFANDVWGFYFNNRGSIQINVTQI